MRTRITNILIVLLAIATWYGMAACNHKKGNPPSEQEIYTCSMHPQIIKHEPGRCPICGMTLVKKTVGKDPIQGMNLTTVLRPTNQFVLSQIPVTVAKEGVQHTGIDAYGFVSYDTRQAGIIAARVSGRIQKLYVRYRFQKVSKGQRIMDIYSPELLAAQQNLLYLVQNDPNNTQLIQAAKERLLLLGMSRTQLNHVIATGKPSFTVTIYSNYDGHIHEAEPEMKKEMPGTMKDVSVLTEALALREGMYVSKDQAVFSVYNPDKVWFLLNIFSDQQSLIKEGDSVTIIPETMPNKKIHGIINFIEPFYQKDSKTLTARAYFNNKQLQLPVGAQVKASIASVSSDTAIWLPEQTVLSLGLKHVVFLKGMGGFYAHEVQAGLTMNNKIQILGGLHAGDTVASNAQYLVDNESFIKANH